MQYCRQFKLTAIFIYIQLVGLLSPRDNIAIFTAMGVGN
jgi:hypothetical protein